MKKFVSLFLVSLLCMSVCVYAANETERIFSSNNDSPYKEMADEYFLHPYTIWSHSGENITQVFYQTMTPAYEAGDYESIAEFLFSNMSHAEAIELTTSPYQTRADYDTIQVSKRYSENVLLSDYESGYGSNTLNYTMLMVYYYHPDREIITDSNNPGLVQYSLYTTYDDPDPEFAFTNYSFDIALNGSYVDYSIDYDIELVVFTDPYTQILDYHYMGTLEHRQFAEP